MDLLRNRIECPDAEERTEILRALSACGYRADGADTARIWGQIKAEVAHVAWSLAARADLGDDEPLGLLDAALHTRVQQARERIVFLLSFLLDARAILQAGDALASSSGAHRAYALEYIDSQVSPQWRAYLLPVLDELPLQQRLHRLNAAFPQEVLGREGRLRAIIAGTEAEREPWLRACALYAAAWLPQGDWAAAVGAALDAPQPLVCETAGWALARLNAPVTGRGADFPRQSADSRLLDPATNQKGAGLMLSTLERVIILKTVSIFAKTPGEVLAAVATILEEVEVRAGEAIVEQGELGRSMYVIVSGKARVHIGDHTLDVMAERDVFGEMALLDPEPRVATVTAIEDTHLFRLDEDPFSELMADRSEIARGIIGVLTARLREAARERAQLHAQLQHIQQADNAAESSRPISELAAGDRI